MSEAPKGAILQRDGQTYAIVPRLKNGILDVNTLKKLTEVVEKYQIPVVKVTGAQRIALVGMSEENVEPIWNELGMEPAPAVGRVVRSVQTCPGTAVCKNGQQDSLNLSSKLDDKYLAQELPNKLKFGISGCPICCAEPWLRDIGVFGKNKGWTLVAGGNAGGRPRIADFLAEGLTDDQALELIDKIINFYAENAKKSERIGGLIDRLGLEEFKSKVL